MILKIHLAKLKKIQSNDHVLYNFGGTHYICVLKNVTGYAILSTYFNRSTALRRSIFIIDLKVAKED